MCPVSCATYGKQKERNLPSKSKKSKTLKLVTCNFIFCNLRCLSLLISRSALNFEHARTCSLALFSDAAHIPYLIMTSNDIILSWTLCLRITHTKHFRLYSHMTWRHMTSCSSANHNCDWILLVDEAVKFSIKADEIFTSQSSSFGIIQNRSIRTLLLLNLSSWVQSPSSARRSNC